MDVKNKTLHWISTDTIDKDGYYRHKECGAILLRVDKSTNINNCYCYCRKCRKEIKLQHIVNGQIAASVTARESA